MTMEDDLRARGRACVWCYGVLIQCFVLTPFTLKNIFYFSPTPPSFFFFFFLIYYYYFSFSQAHICIIIFFLLHNYENGICQTTLVAITVGPPVTPHGRVPQSNPTS